MAGHSQFKNIMHRKGRQDAQKSKLFGKLAREITVAAKMGQPDPAMNARLRAAIISARQENMSKDSIERAVKKASGGDSENYDEIRYEGYGPGGIAVIVEALTDNRNRASAEIRHAFSKHGGNLGEPGSVAWIFEKKGAIVVDGERYGEDDLIGAIDAGAEDVREDEGKLRVICEPADLTAVRAAIEGEGIEVESAGLATEPKSSVELKGHDAERVLKLLEALDDQDDVDEVYANFDIPADVLEKLAA